MFLLVLLLASGTAVAAPVASPSSACERIATVTHLPQLLYPDDARRLHLGQKTAVVAVTIDATGKVTAVSILNSTGVASLDASALQTASQSSYEPAIHECKPVGSTFAFRAEFEQDTSSVSSPLVASTMSPTAAPTACDHPATAVNAVPPAYPDDARQMALGPKTVVVSVSLDETGAITAAQVVQSSGLRSMDAAALFSARRSEYAPAVRRCKPVPGKYLFRSDFQ